MDESLDNSVDENAFDPEYETTKKQPLKERLKAGLPKNFGKVSAISFSILLVATIAIIFISDNGDQSSKVQAGLTTEADMPIDTPSDPPIYGGKTDETSEILESREDEFKAKSDAGESSIADFEFFAEAVDMQEALPVNNSDLFDTDSTMAYIAMSQRPSSGNEVNPDNFTPDVDEVTREELKKPYDFAKMVNEAAIDIAAWDNEIKQMASVTDANVWYSSINSIENSDRNIEPNYITDANSEQYGVTNVESSNIDGSQNVEPFYTFTPSEIQWIQLLSSCNTDEPGVMAEVISGPAKNARLLGSCSLTPLKRIFVKFDLMVIGKDQIIPIDAVVLSAGELRQSVEGKVDNHYFARYVPFIIANFMGAYADALVTTTSLDDNNGGSVTQVNSIPDTNDQLKFASGRTLQALLPGLENSLNRQPTGYLKQYTIFPLMFRAKAEIL